MFVKQKKNWKIIKKLRHFNYKHNDKLTTHTATF